MLSGLEGAPDNWVLSCSLCNHTKSDWDPLEGERGEGEEAMLADDQRLGDLIAAVREHTKFRRATKVDDEWKAVREIMARTWDKLLARLRLRPTRHVFQTSTQ